MGFRHALLFASAVVLFISGLTAAAQSTQHQQGAVPTLRVTSNLVVLDVTVLDKQRKPVVTGLTQDDFSITEDKQPQRIFSFEAPDVHIAGQASPGEKKAPVTILVLDLLNSSFEDFAFIRYSVRKFLLAQPATLRSPAEMLVVGNNSLEMLQGYTRNRADLLYALDHLPAILPFKRMNGMFFWDRFVQSIDALQQIALQNNGVSGRKNVIWVGHGGPNINLTPVDFPGNVENEVLDYVHLTANMLVNARISLFVIYPGLSIRSRSIGLSPSDADADFGETDPFAGNINFGLFVNETGGKLFFDRNDVDAQIQRSEQLGRNYYTLTYQPPEMNHDGKFRRIRVSVRDRNLHVLTKAGYYAPEKDDASNPRQQSMISLAEALESTIPFESLDVNIARIVRHPDARSAELTVQLKTRNLNFLPADNGKNEVGVTVAVASLGFDRSILASRMQHLVITSTTADTSKLPEVASTFSITVPFPRNADDIRLVVEEQSGGRMGAAEIDRKHVEKAPEAPTPNPPLLPRASDQPSPSTSH